MIEHGYMGKLLFIDLENEKSEEFYPGEDFYRRYIGGYGLGAAVLWDRLPAETAPLGPDNIIGFLPGAFAGTGLHGGGRCSVVAKSPLTGGWGDSSCGGQLGPGIRKAGFDGIFVRGRSPRPVYLLVEEGGVKFCNATALWGQTTTDAERTIRKEWGKETAVASIGPAGENLSLIAAIIHDYSRAAARQGLGAVMGSKNLKALAVRGEKKVRIAHAEKQKQILTRLRETARERPRMFNNLNSFGTSAVYAKNVAIQDAPIQNWKGLATEVYPLEKATALTGDSYKPFFRKRYACAQCAIACGAELELPALGPVSRPEYETLASFGSLCLVDDMEAIIRANEFCNKQGLDTISAGATVAFAMECLEQGFIRENDCPTPAPHWGRGEALLPLLEQMVRREGLGKILADGVREAARVLGKATEPFAIHVGGQELGMHDPRCWPGFGYGYVLDPTPGRHTTGAVGFIEHGWSDAELEVAFPVSKLHDPAACDDTFRGEAAAVLGSWFQFFNSTGICLFNKFAYPDYPVLESFRALTGWSSFDLAEALLAGERINTLRHLINLREGLQPQLFNLPERARGVPPLPEGPTAGVTVEVEGVRRAFYETLGWDLKTGQPSAPTLRRLGLKAGDTAEPEKRRDQ